MMRNTMAAGFRALALIGLFFGIGACNDQLETGYVPHKLDASESDRRAYYAPAFSPESHNQKTGSGVDFNALP